MSHNLYDLDSGGTGGGTVRWALKSVAAMGFVAGLAALAFNYSGDLADVAGFEGLEKGTAETAGRQPTAAPAPAPAANETASNRLELRAGPNGHFMVEAWVDGADIWFLVDSGASDVTLTPNDARKLGFNAGNLVYSKRYQTANGIVRGAPVILREVRIGANRLYDVKATVNEAALSTSLLGMSFLSRLAGYEMRGGRMVLHW